MEPITTTAMIAGIVTYIGTQFSKNKPISEFLNEFAGETVKWIKPLLLKEDGSLQNELQSLKSKPKSNARENAVKSVLEISLEDNPEAKKHIKEIFNKIQEKVNSNLEVTNLKSKDGIEIEAVQENSKAKFDNLDTQGKININIKQK